MRMETALTLFNSLASRVAEKVLMDTTIEEDTALFGGALRPMGATLGEEASASIMMEYFA